jgi:hypothetical protein
VKTGKQVYQCSIVIPLLSQRNQWLDECVTSALRQTAACEVIVVTSTETPQTNMEVLQRLEVSNENLILTSCGARNFPGSINKGFRIASADRLGLLMSDDWLDLRAAELCLQHDADIVSTGHSFFAADGVTPLPEIDWTPSSQAYEQLPTLERKASYLKHFFFLRKSKVEEIGGADESLGNFPGIDDFDMIWVLLEHRASVAIEPVSLYNMRDHSGERLTLRSSEDSILGLQRILRKHGISDAEAVPIIDRHARWYGIPVSEAYRRIKSGSQ